jgi:hypothetical protein
MWLPLLNVLKIRQLKFVAIFLHLVPNILHKLELCILALVAVPGGMWSTFTNRRPRPPSREDERLIAWVGMFREDPP